MCRNRVYLPSLLDKVMSATEAADPVQDGMTVGISGFARTGRAKAIPQALAMCAKERPLCISLMTGASLGNDLNKQLTEAGVFARRTPFQVDGTLRKVVNADEMIFIDQHLSETVGQLCNHQPELPDIAVIEAVVITEQGHIVSTTSVGSSASFVVFAKQVIAEINLAHSTSLEDLHGIYILTYRPTHTPIPLTRVDDHIGSAAVPISPEKAVATVISDQLDSPSTVLPPDDEAQAITSHLIDFSKRGINVGRIGNNLGPLQTGIGSIVSAVVCGLIEPPFENLTMYSEVLQGSTFNLIDASKLCFTSDSSTALLPRHDANVLGNLGHYKDELVLRPQGISNHPGMVRRLGIIGINMVLEFDIYNNASSTHVGGTKMMNGIGGPDDFAHNAHLAIFVTGSIAKDDNISSVMPMVSHADHTEHDVDILAAKQGLVDLRGPVLRERAWVIIENCVHPSYQIPLLDYFEAICVKDDHTPHLLRKTLAWHLSPRERGRMLTG